jgi:arylsulfatase A-like enzyme
MPNRSVTLLLAAGLAACHRGRAQPPGQGPNLVLVVWEATRADHSSAYGFPLRTTPNLELLAQESVRFDQHISAAPWTLPSVVSMLTGHAPATHGVQSYEDEVFGDLRLVSERLRDGGYHTAFIGSNSFFEHERGFEQGWDFYHGIDEVAGSELLVWLLSWLDERPDDRPFFLYIHLFEPHCPYLYPDHYERMFRPQPPRQGRDAYLLPEWEQLFPCYKFPQPDEKGPPVLEIERYLAAYDAELHQVDHYTGLVLQQLDVRGLLDRSLVMVTADHGETFLDHGDHGHGRQLYAESVRVPLVVRPPMPEDGSLVSAAGSVVSIPTSGVDLVPTLLSMAGLPMDPELAGRDLSPAWAGSADTLPAERAIFSATDHEAHLRSVQQGGWLMIADGSTGFHELYELDSDPEQQVDLSREQPERLADLQAQLAEHEQRSLALSATADRASRPLDPEIEAALRRLGYLE